MARTPQSYSSSVWLQLAALLLGAVFINAVMLAVQPIVSAVLLYVSVNIVLLCTGAYTLWFSIRIQKIYMADADKLRSAVALLEDKLELKASRDDSPAAALAKVTSQVTHLLKRDQEVRHLVRVQGLIDHELAVGNRVFFESKLQHYLSDQSEVGYGAVYIVQLSHPEISRAGIKQVSRLKGCVDVLNGIAAGYADTVIARLSDTDLVMLIAGLSGKEMEKLGDRMAVLLSRASCFADCAGQDVLHIGYAGYQREQTSYQILSEADMALKTAQLHGPNAAFGFILQSDKPQAKGSVWWRSELNKALQEQRFALSFQPVFSWHDGEIIQHEVLVRLQSNDNGQIPAAIFLPMAHNCGLSSQIDQHVLIKTAKLCAADMGNYSRCSVNISIQALLEPQWWQWLDHMVISGQLEPDTLALEITEHHLLKHYKQLRKSLIKLHTLGFALIIDQVGLVIDNAVYLDELPLESVKLHPSVVRNIDQHLEQQLFVRGLIASYAGKSIRVLATGVELEAEWQVLQKLGIAGGQGFYFSQPMNQIITQSQL
ncbi:RNase E specificity factor CsrD [Rheinheimera pacifica]|uniref:RNase E specificity factor CsrD n=2 Tax=Rheinheimera pacifica TaxID=173990 RepID=A0A1H6N8J8_9GAMM|nr:RNase E specificity factor CsrD [Rheinheimera pacifica]